MRNKDPATIAMQTCHLLIVDDEIMVRQGLSARLSTMKDIKVVGVSSGGPELLPKLFFYKPDVVILDLEVPNQNGLEILRTLRRDFPDTIVIGMASSSYSAKKVPADLLTSGYSEIVIRPRQVTTIEHVLDELAGVLEKQLISIIKKLAIKARAEESRIPFPEPEPKSRLLTQSPTKSNTPETPFKTDLSKEQNNSDPALKKSLKTEDQDSEPAPEKPRARFLSQVNHRVDIVLIASSTGGPNALYELIPMLPAEFPVPILIVQHMPAEFTKSLADRINQISHLEVREARKGDKPKPGLILIAPGNYHMLLEESGPNRQIVVSLNQSPPENSCRPAADVLFRSAVKIYGPHILAMVLTGMGKDGLAGTFEIKSAGGRVVVQDEHTSIVWGMPGEVAKAGLADSILPLYAIGPELLRIASVGRPSFEH